MCQQVWLFVLSLGTHYHLSCSCCKQIAPSLGLSTKDLKLIVKDLLWTNRKQTSIKLDLFQMVTAVGLIKMCDALKVRNYMNQKEHAQAHPVCCHICERFWNKSIRQSPVTGMTNTALAFSIFIFYQRCICKSLVVGKATHRHVIAIR